MRKLEVSALLSAMMVVASCHGYLSDEAMPTGIVVMTTGNEVTTLELPTCVLKSIRTPGAGRAALGARVLDPSSVRIVGWQSFTLGIRSLSVSDVDAEQNGIVTTSPSGRWRIAITPLADGDIAENVSDLLLADATTGQEKVRSQCLLARGLPVWLGDDVVFFVNERHELVRADGPTGQKHEFGRALGAPIAYLQTINGLVVTRANTIEVLDPDTGETKRVLVRGQGLLAPGVVCSPDGAFIVYARAGWLPESWGTYLLDLRSGRERRIAPRTIMSAGVWVPSSPD